MLHLITGGSGSGKSAYAEEQVLLAGSGKRIYIATMIPYGEEGKKRVARHLKLRKEKQFATVEWYTHLEQLKVPNSSIVLVECLSNLVANEIFEPTGAHENTVETVIRGVRALMLQTKHLFLVTNEVFSDGIAYDAETIKYIACLGEVNQKLALLAEHVTEVVYGIPVELKQ